MYGDFQDDNCIDFRSQVFIHSLLIIFKFSFLKKKIQFKMQVTHAFKMHVTLFNRNIKATISFFYCCNNIDIIIIHCRVQAIL